MGIDLTLAARIDSGSGLMRMFKSQTLSLEAVSDWLTHKLEYPFVIVMMEKHERFGKLLKIELHPCAEPVEIYSPAKGLVRIEARTNQAGAGYHIYLCELLKELGAALGWTWLPRNENRDSLDCCCDEGEYFHSGKIADAEEAHIKWFGLTAAKAREMAGEGSTDMATCLPLDALPQLEAAVLLPMGPRSYDWLERAAANPRINLDGFPWPEGDGKLDDAALLQFVVASMWSRVFWRAPLDDGEVHYIQSLADVLEQLHGRHPGWDFPWREWHELNGYLEAEGKTAELVAARAAAMDADKPLIGYRRHPARVRLAGGWSLVVPGTMRHGYSESSWDADDDGVELHVAVVKPKAEEPATAQEMLDRLFDEHHGAAPERIAFPGRPELAASAVALEADEGDGEQLAGVHAGPENCAVATFLYTDPARRPWAINTFLSLKHDPPAEKE